jgi:hypothetical protein
MVEKFGSDQQQIATLGGGVISEDGATLLSGESLGESALLFGPAALREIQAGVANGDFAITPADDTATITADNPLPYWTFTDTNSAGAITCAIVTDTSAGSGNALRWSVTAAMANSKSAKLSRFIPVASTRNRAFAYSPEVNTFNATNTANVTITMTAQFYKSDQTTTTGSSITSGAITFATLGTGSNWLQISGTTANAAPSDAAYCLVTITVATAAAGVIPAATVDLPEVRLIRGDQTNLFAEYTTPATYAPTLVRQVNGTLQISPNAGTGAVQIGGALNLDTRHTIEPLNTGSIQFTRNDTNTRSNLIADRLFIGDQITRYIDDDGTRTSFSGGIDVNASSTMTSAVLTGTLSAFTVFGTSGGTSISASGGGDIEATGADTSVPISGNGELTSIPNTTTATTNSARWVSLGSNRYGLRRDSSTRRVKTNIHAADDSVLEAVKRLRAVHFEPLEKDEQGNLRGTGQLTLGLIAEEIEEAGLGCAVTYDSEGLPDGYDERVLIAALLHHVNDLEERLQALEG